MSAPRPPRRTAPALALGLAGALLLAGCADPSDGGSTHVTGTAGQKVKINLSPQQHRITSPKVAKIAAELPASVRRRGTLDVVDSAESAAPLTFRADDNRTIIGVEPDLAYLIGGVLGLKVRLHPVSWENIFVGLDSGKYDAGFSNITDTEERKQKYDFASYRKDNVAFEAKKGSKLKVRGPKDVAGRTVAVDSGTNQEKLLLDWAKQDRRDGLKPPTIRYYKAATDTYLALQSGRIDLYLGPNPVAAYHVATAGKTQIVGTQSGAGGKLQGLISATTKKGSGLAKPLADAIDATIRNGSYAKVLKRWGLSSEAVTKSQVNPPGLPTSLS